MASLSGNSAKTQKHQEQLSYLLAAGVAPATIAEYWMNVNKGRASGSSVKGTIDTAGEVADIWKLHQQKIKSGQTDGVAGFIEDQYSGVAGLREAQYNWQPNKYLPGIQEQAGAIYDPRMQQNELLAQLQRSQASEARAQTKEDFDQRLQAEIEAMNQRGAFYSGGAIRGEQDIRNEQMRTLERQDLQAQAAQQELLAQRGTLGYEQAQFEQNQLYNNEASAYNRWKDERDYNYMFETNERAFNYNRWKDERDYNYMFETNERAYATQALMGTVDAWQIRNQFDLSNEQFQFQQEQFKEDTRRWNEEFAWNKFIYKQSQK